MKKSFFRLFLNPSFQFFFVFALIMMVRFFPFWFLGKTLVFGDNYSLMVPGKLFTAQWLEQGVLPLWNPLVFSGMPWVADINQSVLHPSTLLFMIFQPGVALNVLIAGHLFIAYSGMYLLAKKWGIKMHFALLAAVLWMLSTQITGSINNFSTLQSIVWLPFLGYFGLRVFQERRARWLFAGAVLLQFFGGYPQHVLYGILLGVGLSWWQDIFQGKNGRKRFWLWILRWLETGVWTIGLSAVAWLPFLDMLLHSTRMLQSEEQALVGSLNPVMLIKLVIPYFWDNPRAGMKWGPAWNGQPNVAFYLTWLGVIVLVQRIWSLLGDVWVGLRKKSKKVFRVSKREDWFFALIVVGTLVFSLGEYLPGFSVIQKSVPLFRIARYPSMVMIVTNVILILWVARSLENWKLNKRVTQWLLVGSGLLTASSLAGMLVIQNGFSELWYAFDRFVSFSLSASPFHTIERDFVILSEILKSVLYISIIFFGIVLIYWQVQTRRKQKMGKSIWPVLFVLVMAVEIGFATHGQFFFAPRDIYDRASKGAFFIPAEVDFQTARVLTRNSNVPYTDYGSYWEALVVRAPFSDSFVDSQELRGFEHVKNLRDGLTPNWNMVYEVPMVHGYTTLLPQEYEAFWSTSDQVGINFINSAVAESKKFDQWAVRYYLVDDWFQLKEGENFEEFQLVERQGRWSWYERPKALPKFRWQTGEEAEMALLKETPNVLTLAGKSEGQGQSLVVANRFDKDWQVKVNNKKRTFKNEDGMWAVELDEGENVVEFRYVPRWFYVGLGVSGGTAVLLLGQKMILRKRKSKKLI